MTYIVLLICNSHNLGRSSEYKSEYHMQPGAHSDSPSLLFCSSMILRRHTEQSARRINSNILRCAYSEFH